jgi:hypothetical protein
LIHLQGFRGDVRWAVIGLKIKVKSVSFLVYARKGESMNEIVTLEKA